MIPNESLKGNFRFLVIEVEGQVKLTAQLLEKCNEDLLNKIASKDDYIDNLKSVVENECFSALTRQGAVAQEDLNTLRAIHIMAVNLERIGDFCVNIARQTRYLSSAAIIQHLNHREMMTAIENALSRITHVFLSRDLSGALSICRSEYLLDRMFTERFHSIMTSLRESKEVEDLVTALFIFRYLERIGDALLNIGEALLFAIKGEKLKIEQYEALQETLSHSHLKATIPELEVKSILGSRSGCRISRLQPKHGDQMQAIFKEGNKQKIRTEHENMRQWETIQPGLTPKIFGFHQNEESASIIVEYISGLTLDEILLNGEEGTLTACLEALMKTIRTIWRKTQRYGVFATDYMAQLNDRLEGICRVHPAYCRQEKALGHVHIPSSVQLIESCRRIEQAVPSPCQVFIHGDFNVNNVFYEPQHAAIRYIDLYRSRFADYIQDASVFLISNYRIPVFAENARGRLNGVIQQFLDFFRAFSQEIGDTGFEARMALALVRSFYTSTRFELNPGFSNRMFLSAHYLMESLAAHDGPWNEFTIPMKVLLY